MATIDALDDDEEFERIEMAALTLSMQLWRTISNRARRRQIDWMVAHRGWESAAMFASYSCQIHYLGLGPLEQAPCHCKSADDPRPIGEGEEGGTKLLHKMEALGISRWCPDPLRAISEVEASAA